MAIEESTTGIPPRSSPRSRGGAVLIVALVVDSIGNGLFLPLGLIFFTKITDVPLILIGVLLSVANIMQLPIPVFAGALADRYGARPLVVLAQVLQALGYFAAGLVTGPAGILVSAVLTALGVRFFWSSVFTLIADYVDGSSGGRSKDYWYGWSNMARTGGLGVGGVLTGIALANPQTSEQVFRLIAFGTAGCFAIAAVTIALVVRAPRPVQPGAAGPAGYRDLLRDRPYLGLIGVNVVFALSGMMLPLALPTLVVIHLDADAWLVSAVLVGNTIAVSLLTAPVVLRLRPFRRTGILAAAAALWVAWALLFAVLVPGQLGWGIPVLIGAVVVFTAASVMHAPVSIGLAAAAAPAETRGRYLAIFQYSFTLAEIVGPGFFTTLFAVAHGLPWVALAALNGLAIVALFALQRRLPAAALRDE
ncbi:MFS transporter [Amycolatopsis sp. NPDC026612]|uniref:MFS transporter n=1 Tax=Amycolatopsis sp. NPDC026612 TaxID=3155466 RepID=UPI0033EB7D5C